MKTITASDRKTLIRLASSLPVGDDTRKAILQGLAETREAGRPWGGAGYKPKAEDYEIKNKNGPGTPPCQPEGEGECYRKHNEYGAANSGSNGSAARRKYNEKYRDEWM